jgi:peptide/nickel transport system substrate-binding protein
MVMLFANTKVAPFADARVRKALSMAIDRQRVVTGGHARLHPPADATGLSDAYERYRDPAAVAAGAGLDEARSRRAPAAARRGRRRGRA